MIERITIDTYLKKHSKISIIDVRSPGEFQKGHIPNAYNISLFSDDERARVGTAYKQQSKTKAIELGYVFVAPKLEYFIEESRKLAPNGTIAVHCWRGGMRSEAFAKHLSENGFKQVFVIEKGYKAFRNYVLSYFDNKFKLIVIGGYTGSGKTEILAEIAKQNKQVVDLELLANHKGSAFGGIGQLQQPTSEFFENILFQAMRSMNINEPIWIEDESMNIGKIFLPKALFDQMRDQMVYFIDIPRIERAKFLVENYGNQNDEALKEAIYKISRRLGPQNTKEAIESIEKGNFLKVAELS
jgi:tRNA 2-selenouridine synthase